MRKTQILFMLLIGFYTLIAQSINAQESATKNAVFKISGTIVDENDDALIGATLAVKGGSGTVTNIDGKFSLTCKQNSIVTISYVGYENQNIIIVEKREYKIVLKSNAKLMDEVVVIGYGESKRKDLTGSVSAVNSATLSKTGATDFGSALQGRIAGVKVTTQSSEAGAGVGISIRGTNSLYAGSAPLYVIDGMQIDINESEVATSKVGGQTTYNPLASINPNDIESIDVLKDASSTAIYGARGANGVIIVTTKSAKNSQKTDVSLDASFGVSQIAKGLNMLDGQGYIDYKFDRGVDLTVWGKDYGDGNGVVPRKVDTEGYPTYNWQDELTRIGTNQTYNLSLNSILNKTRISSGIGYNSQDGIVRSNGFDRYSGKIKIDHEINKKLKMGASATIGRVINKGAVTNGGTNGTGGYTGMVQFMYLERPVFLYTPTELSTEFVDGYVPLTSMVNHETYKKTLSDRLITGAYISYFPITGLELKLNGSTSNTYSKLQEFYSTNSKWGKSYQGRASILSTNSDAYTLTATANYNKSIQKKHQINALLGAEINSYYYESFSIQSNKFEDQTTGVFDISKGLLPQLPASNVYTINRASLFGRVSYNYLGKYYLTSNLRADASSNFDSKLRTGYFPSVSVAWRASDELFMKRVNFISNLKFRASAGSTGNDRIPAYTNLAKLGTSYYASNNNVLFGLNPISSENKNLKWETTDQYNIGMDLDLFNNKVSIVADVYQKNTRDMLYNAYIPAQSGFAKQWMNIGRMSNKGLEVSIITRNIDKKNFSWNSTVSFDANRSKVLELGGESFFPLILSYGSLLDVGRVIVGKPLGTIYGYEDDGNYQLTDFVCKDKNTGVEVDASTITSANLTNYNYTLKPDVVSVKGATVQPGDRKYKDLNGNDNVITPDDRKVLGQCDPLFNFGISNDFKIYDFDLSFFIEGSYGGKILNTFRAAIEPGMNNTVYNITRESWMNRWRPENPTNDYPRILNQFDKYTSSRYVEDGSFIRLKNVVLGYTLDKKIMRNLGINKMRFYVLMDNLILLTNYKGLDPDVRSPEPFLRGMDQSTFPRTKSVTLGLNVNF